MVQVIKFSSGGFVAHKIRIEGSNRRFSAWFDSDGNLVDSEGFDQINRSGKVTVKQQNLIKQKFKELVNISKYGTSYHFSA